jgi:6-pyruvoyl-tetrahydropterin synthase
LKTQLREVLREFDHTYLNTLLPCNATAENLARIIYQSLDSHSSMATQLRNVAVDETPETRVTYIPDKEITNEDQDK